MEVGGRSSSIDLSSAPSSSPEPVFPPHVLASTPKYSTTPSDSTLQRPSIDAYRNLDAAGVTGVAPSTARQDPPKQKRPRKPKDPGASASDATKPKVQRKPRAAPGTGPASKRKPKAENTENQAPIQNIPPSTELQSSRLVEPYAFPQQPFTNSRSDEAAKYSQNGLLSHDQSRQPPSQATPAYSSNYTPQPQPQPSLNPSRSSAIYDPVRSITTPRQPEPAQPLLTPNSHSTPPRPTSRAGASPLANLIDGPMPTYSTAPSPLRSFVTPADQPPQAPRSFEPGAVTISSGSMDVDIPCADDTTSRKPSIVKKPSSEGPTRATSPKPARAKEKPPPLPAGSGLLSASLFGGEIGTETSKNSTAKGPNIVLHIDLKNPNNKVINFARLAEEKYGFDALYPQQAAQRKRLNEIAARGAALERSASGSKVGGTSAGESGEDDVSVDIDPDSENDGDVAMGGLNGTDQANSGTDGPEPKRRRRKVEDYDQEDPFIDDSEQIWEQQAAASKDGFFVYCGPLVPEGEKPAVERADGTVKRGGRGRGRGGGPGSRGGRGARAAAAARDAGGADGEASRPSHGPGSRGGNIKRAPRARKADRPQTVEEKAAREKGSMLASKPVAYPS